MPLISIHSPHARGDAIHNPSCHVHDAFQSTPLMRGETDSLTIPTSVDRISIHSPHARGDPMRSCIRPIDRDFNPLPSCEGRPSPLSQRKGVIDFNPLPSCEGRRGCCTCCGCIMAFQSTPLMRGETPRPDNRHADRTISIHSPHARGDKSPSDTTITIKISIHSPHAR